MELNNVIDIFRNVKNSPEYKASLIDRRTQLEMKRWELATELELIQGKIEEIDSELS